MVSQAELKARAEEIMKNLKCSGKEDPITAQLPPGPEKDAIKRATTGHVDVMAAEEKYYNREKNKLKKIYLQKKRDVEYGPGKLKSDHIEYEKYKILGDPTINTAGVEEQIKSLYTTINNRHIATAQEIYTHSIEQHDQNARELETLLNYYKSAESYSNRMHNLLTMKQEENKTLELELEDILAGSTTNERKVVYEQYDLGNIHHTRKIMYYVYYLLFILYLVFGRFFSAEEYRRYSVWIGIILYVTLPFYITYVTDGLVYLYRKFIYVKENKLSKNVYLDI